MRHNSCAPDSAQSVQSFQDGKLRSPTSSIPGVNAGRSRRARTCSDSVPKTASMTAWVPTSISVISRTFPNAAIPRRLRAGVERQRIALFRGYL